MMLKSLLSKNTRGIILLSLFFFSVNNILAIPLEIGGEEPPCGEPFGAPCPLDGGLMFLAAAAAVYGGKKVYSRQQK